MGMLSLIAKYFGFGSRASDGFPSGADAVGGGPSSNFWYGLIRSETKSGVSVNEETALTYAAVWCATMRRVGVMSYLPKNLYRVSGRSRNVARDRSEHWLLKEKPNPDMNATHYHAMMEEWRVNAGNAYAEIEWDISSGTRRAKHLWPIHPSNVKVLTDSETNGYVYEVKTPRMKEASYIYPHDMIHLRSIVTRGTMLGIGVIDAARETIGMGLATEQHGAASFGDRGLPDIIVKVPGEMPPESRQAFRRDWRDLHSGPSGGNVGILDRGADAMPLTISNEAMQFLATRQHNVEEISRWYDIPPHMLHHLLRMTNNNVEHQGIEAVVYSFMPWIVAAEQEYLVKLFPDEIERRDLFFKWEVNGLLRGDMQARSAFYREMIASGVFSPNIVLELEDWNPYEGGDSRYMQGAMAKILSDGSLEMASKAESGDEPEYDSSDDDESEESEQPADQESGMRSVAMDMLSASLCRLVARECMSLKRAASEPQKFLKSVESFYSGHRWTVSRELEPILRVCQTFGVSGYSHYWADELCNKSQSEVVDLAGRSTADSLSENVQDLTAAWESSRAKQLIELMTKINGENHGS
jgi:HK97 family phage portal protein